MSSQSAGRATSLVRKSLVARARPARGPDAEGQRGPSAGRHRRQWPHRRGPRRCLASARHGRRRHAALGPPACERRAQRCTAAEAKAPRLRLAETTVCQDLTFASPWTASRAFLCRTRPTTSSSTAIWYACAACAGQAVWHPERHDVVCTSCGTAIALPPRSLGTIPTFGLVAHLRDAPENRRTWISPSVQLPCPMCGSVRRLRADNLGRAVRRVQHPLLRPLQEGDAPLAPNGVVPLSVSEGAAGIGSVHVSRTPSAAADFGPIGLEIVSLQRTYLPYWRFSAHVHCPFRGVYRRTSHDGNAVDIAHDGVIDEEYGDTASGVASFPVPVWELEPMAIDEAVPFDRRYLAGATVEHYAVGLWDAWDDVHARIEARIKRTMRKAGAGSMPDEVWPTWSRQTGCLILVPLYVAECRFRGHTWPAVVHGRTGKVGDGADQRNRPAAIAAQPSRCTASRGCGIRNAQARSCPECPRARDLGRLDAAE